MGVKFRRGNQAALIASNLLPAEAAYCLDTKRLLVGDGTGGADIIPTGAEVEQMILDAFAATLADARRGTIAAYAGSTAPTGTLLCDGAAVSRITYAALFAILGTRYGSGNGSTTFNLPNLKGRVPVGMDALQSEFDALGETGGAKTHTLTESQIPIHAHNIKSASAANDGAINTNQLAVGKEGTIYANKNPIETAGGGLAHNNLQPYTVVNYIIYY